MLTLRLSRKQSWQSKFILEQKTYTSTNTNATESVYTHTDTQIHTHTSKINILTHSKLHLFTPWYDVWFEMYTTAERKEKWKIYRIWGRTMWRRVCISAKSNRKRCTTRTKATFQTLLNIYHFSSREGKKLHTEEEKRCWRSTKQQSRKKK